jgi:hypothetical protein
MRKDLELFNALQPILLALSQLQDMVEDTALTANAEAYSYALAVYNYAKASGTEAALAGAVEELGKLFVKKPAASAARPQGQP